MTVFVIISGTFNRKQTPYHQKLKNVILAATGLLVEDAVSSFYQYFYFELYNDIEVWKRRTLMEKTIMNENFQVNSGFQQQSLKHSIGEIRSRKAYCLDFDELSFVLSHCQARVSRFLTFSVTESKSLVSRYWPPLSAAYHF